MGVEEADVHALHVAEDVAAQVKHDLLAGPLHQVSLNELKEIGAEQGSHIDGGQVGNALVGVGGKAAGEPVGGGAGRAGEIAINGDFDQIGPDDIAQ
jgi:hypothetical protein